MAKFKIRKLPNEPKPRQQSETPEPPPEPVALGGTGGLFRDCQRLLRYLGSLAGMGLAHEAICRRAPDGNRWWAQIAGIDEQAIELVRAQGGTAYLGRDQRWATAPLGRPAAEELVTREVLDLEGWPAVEPGDLVTQLALVPSHYIPRAQLGILTNGILARWILIRASGIGLQTTLQSARTEDGRAALWLTLTAGKGTVPTALVQRMTALPGTAVYAEAARGAFHVDVTGRLPLDHQFLADLLPPQQHWLLGGSGNTRLQLMGEARNGADLIAPPVRRRPQTVGPATANMPAKIPQRLVAASRHRPIGAVLLDDYQLEKLSLFLRLKASGAKTYLIPGAGRHLLLAPADLTEQIPLGTPLYHQGPGALYLELGQTLHPALPGEARRTLYDLDGETVVALTRAGAWRFTLEHLTPSWTLWAATPKTPEQTLSATGQTHLARLHQHLNTPQIKLKVKRTHPQLETPIDKDTLRQRALRAKQQGDPITAAQLLEQAKDHAEAAKLYEQAARN